MYGILIDVLLDCLMCLDVYTWMQLDVCIYILGVFCLLCILPAKLASTSEQRSQFQLSASRCSAARAQDFAH